MKLSIPDMTCGHCKASVERAVRTLDGAAEVVVDLGAHTAEVRAEAAPEAILKALADEGYPASVLA